MATVSELIIERQNNVSKDFRPFREYVRHSSFSAIAEVIERKNAQLKANYVPWAPGVVIASDYLLHAAGHNPTSVARKDGACGVASSIERTEGSWSAIAASSGRLNVQMKVF